MYSGDMEDFLAAMSLEEVQAVIPNFFTKVECTAEGFFIVYGDKFNPETAEMQKWCIDTQHHRVLYQNKGWKSSLKNWTVVATW